MTELTFSKTTYTTLGEWGLQKEPKEAIVTPTHAFCPEQFSNKGIRYTRPVNSEPENQWLLTRSQRQVYTLEEACSTFFANTGIEPSDFLKLNKRKKLKLVRMGKKTLVSIDSIHEMLLTCQERRNPQDSGSKGERAENPFGASSTEDARSARAALSQELEKLKESSSYTSPKSVKRQENGRRGRSS